MGMFDALFGARKNREKPSTKVWAPRKGLFTQCSCVLLDAPLDLATVARTLRGFEVVDERPPAGEALGDVYSGPSLTIAYRPEVNGYATVDIVDRPWPDAMGDPTGPDASIFASWGLGAFGPSTYPGSLERAVQHAYAYPDARRLVPRHRAFLRVRSSYVLGAKSPDPIAPKDYDALGELRFVTDLVLAALDVPSALCAFNPNGEVLRPAEDLARIVARDRDGGGMAVEAWANVRMFRPGKLGEQGWMLYDLIGMQQLDLCDHEASIPRPRDDESIPGLLWALAAYDVEQGGVVRAGDTIPGAGERLWRAKGEGDSLLPAPRPVLRWFPDDVVPPPILVPRPERES